MQPPKFTFLGPLPKIYGTQIGLKNPAQVDALKADMLAGRYAYHEVRGQISGVRDSAGCYYVRVGHHRLVAALEIFRETASATPVHLLLLWGHWDNVQRPPIDWRPLPLRDWWGRLRHWLGV